MKTDVICFMTMQEFNITPELASLGITSDSTRLLGKSSNFSYLVSVNGKDNVLKFPAFSSKNLSPFWKQMEELFDLDSNSKFLQQKKLVEILKNNNVLGVPEVLVIKNPNATLGAEYATLNSFIYGRSHAADEFPTSEKVHEQLGEYIGFLHSHTFEGFGNLTMKTLKPSDKFFDLASDIMKSTIKEFWKSDPEILKVYEKVIQRADKVLLISQMTLIMPDISGNQFVFGKDLDTISGVVDLDSYVIGPRELELAIVETAITCPTSFKRGYEKYLPFPRFNAFREFYRFLSFLNDPAENADWGEFRSRNIFFE